ncbi:MAG: response regulator [Armatimonadetes bacterium]|nr:response regulator [Armatimonadota bacterium]
MENLNHLLLVYFFYGLSFVFMGALLLLQPRRDQKTDFMENLWFLGIFAVLHGLNEWVDMVNAFEASYWNERAFMLLHLVKSFLNAMSFVCLFQFAIGILTADRARFHWMRWLPLVGFGLWLGSLLLSGLMGKTINESLLSLEGWPRYMLGLTGGLLTCYAFLTQKEKLGSTTVRKILLCTAVFFGINAFLSVFTASEASFQAAFGRVIDISPFGLTQSLVLFRALCAVVITITIVQALVMMDVDQNRKLLAHQQELIEANEQLQETVRKLKETQEQLVQSEKMSAVGTLVSGIAHEFNNILSGLKGYTQLARASKDVTQIQKDLETIEEAADRTIEITRNLLSWVRPEKVRRDVIDINQVITQAVNLVTTTFAKRNITVTTRLAPVPGVAMSKAEIQDIVMNLIINASHAIDESKDGQIKVSSGIDDGKVVISVSDNGCGIPAENLSKIFLPFFTTKGALGGSDTPGTGLGLYVVYGIIKGYNGDVKVDSEVGKGTTFRIILPIPEKIWQDVAAPENPQVDAEALSLLARLNVLVVENEPLLREALVRYLEDKTAEVVAAQNGREALATVRQREFDVIFLDLLMPGINGLETLRRLKEIVPDVPVVLMTGKLERNIREQVMLRGAADLIRKPFEFNELTEIVRRVARGRVRRSIA